SRLPARLSRKVLITGMPPATAASKASATPASSARAASRVPFSAINALLAVTTCFLWASAVSMTWRATPSAPPINSTTASISGSAAIATASSYQRTADRSTPRSRRRSRADTAATMMRRPARTASSSAWRASNCKVPPPTVPSPATAIFNADFTGTLRRRSWRELDVDTVGRGGGRCRRRFGLDLVGRDAGGAQRVGDRLRPGERGVIAAERLAAGGAGRRGTGIGDDANRARLLAIERRDPLDLSASVAVETRRGAGQFQRRHRDDRRRPP